MLSLYEWQREFLTTLLRTADDAEASNTASESVADFSAQNLMAQDLAVEGLAIHRNNWRSNLMGALRVTYPVTERLVGVDFFTFAANQFIDSHPSRSANLDNYGKEFVQFLRTFAPAQSLPYLADVACLEKIIDILLSAADTAPSYTLHSPFPILRIWQVNQPDWQGEDVVHLDSGAEYLLIHRPELEVLIEPVDAIRFEALVSQQDRAMLGGAE